ncbi:MAG: TonB family protein [Acidobacteria bacterium]|nr:TonB family protein [Acidobacteriota bacterium]
MKKESAQTPGAPLQATVFSATDPPDISPASKDWEAYTNFLLQNFLAELNLQEQIGGCSHPDSVLETCLDLRQDRPFSPEPDRAEEEESWPTVRLRRHAPPAEAAAEGHAPPAESKIPDGRTFTFQLLWSSGFIGLVLLVSLLFFPWTGTSIWPPSGGEEIAPVGRLPLGQEFALIHSADDRPFSRVTPSARVKQADAMNHPASSPAAEMDLVAIRFPSFTAIPSPTISSPNGITGPAAIHRAQQTTRNEIPTGHDDLPSPHRPPREYVPSADDGNAGDPGPPSSRASDECPVSDPPPQPEPVAAPAEKTPLRPVGSAAEKTSPIPSPPVLAQENARRVVALSDCSRKPVLVGEIRPVRPWNAQRMNKKGRVVVRVLITDTGRVETATLILERPTGFGFGEAALEAARRCRYEPAQSGGRFVHVWETLIFDFR